ncbi:Antitoxin component YwqK of the YwqJK toxin-antitoxin module [Reichenbachiella faecimaris]|uniref:Antitoxin component YwqK of the YwqJK toxin-antitoxin module n=1 Tax=Reichenbachiella faecimaris TaxID=692418 RepID=A0A1W2GMU7_REIFA|nr:toxin-antitoxin system YwqK family antitoxin [Reichenbachiella faecimaris]SMD37884.1 Antitoxin component YwqK of the YwqJK toxin-antitoxin module [Reichenbachiella faecimaris]
MGPRLKKKYKQLLDRYFLVIIMFGMGCTNDQHEVKEYYPNGNLFYLGFIKDNLEEGTWTYWYENGQKEEKGDYKQGKKEGLWKYWFEGGGLRKKASYEEGLHDGAYEEYHSNGQIKETGFFTDGQKDSQWCQWSKGGKLLAKVNFRKGLFHGEMKSFYETGSISAYGIYKEGKMDSLWTSWYSNGNMAMVLKVEKGQQLFLSIWDSLGNYQVENGEGTFYYPVQGEKGIVKGQIKQMKPIGKWQYYDDHANLVAEDSLIYSLIKFPSIESFKK